MTGFKCNRVREVSQGTQLEVNSSANDVFPFMSFSPSPAAASNGLQTANCLQITPLQMSLQATKHSTASHLEAPLSTMSSPAEELPYELWVQILQHVPQQQHFSSCALVCQKLARAAAAATASVRLNLYRPQRHDDFLSWYSSHSSFQVYCTHVDRLTTCCCGRLCRPRTPSALRRPQGRACATQKCGARLRGRRRLQSLATSWVASWPAATSRCPARGAECSSAVLSVLYHAGRGCASGPCCCCTFHTGSCQCD